MAPSLRRRPASKKPEARVKDRRRSFWPAQLGLESLEDRTLLSAVPLPRPQFIIFNPAGSANPNSASPVGYVPSQVRHAYGIDQVSFLGGTVVGDGKGQTIAIVDAFDNPAFVNSNSAGFNSSDLHQFDLATGLPDPPSFVKINQNGGTSYPVTDLSGGWETEEALDVEWAHAIAPGANIVLVEASSPTYANLLAAETTARSLPGVCAVSNSWSSGEFPQEAQFDSTFVTPSGHTGVTFLFSTGDFGAPGGYPAYSPNVVAVGGTSLFLNSSNNWAGESAWSGSGGGISTYESQPGYQKGVVTQSTTQRTTPDVSFVADPATGVAIYDSFNFGTSPWIQIGGTSLSCPCWAGLVAITDQGIVADGGKPLDGLAQALPRAYKLPGAAFHDIIQGTNGFPAGPGYDLVTGIGTPIANVLIPALASQPVTQFKVTSSAATVAAGVPFSITVRAVDAGGVISPAYTGTVHFTSSDTALGVVLPANYTFTAADAGIHTFTGVVLKTSGSQTITTTDNGGITGVVPLTVTPPASAAKLSVQATPSSVPGNATFSLTVSALDTTGRIVATGYLGTVHFTSSDVAPGVVLPANYTFTPFDNGVHTFTGVVLQTTGAQTVTATDTVTSTITGLANVTVLPPQAAASFSVTASASSTIAGTPLAVTVTATDAVGNVASTYQGTVHFSSSDLKAVLPGNYTFTLADHGVHTFSVVTLKTAGPQQVIATDTLSPTVTGQVIVTVSPAAAVSLAVGGYPSPVTAATAAPLTVAAVDAFGNVATGYLGTVAFTSSDARAVLPAPYTFVASDNGVHTFNVTLKTAGIQSITARDTANSAIAGSETGIQVNPGPINHFLVGAPASVPAFARFAVTVTAVDAGNNVLANYRGTVQFSLTDPLGVVPPNYTFTAGDAGVHTFANAFTMYTVGNQAVTAADTLNATVRGSAAITVTGLTSLAWTGVGPAPIGVPGSAGTVLSGRINGLAQDPAQPGVIYVGSAGGGVWKSTNGGASWTSLTDNEPSLRIGAIAVAVDQRGRHIIYAGTGDPHTGVGGEGILVSFDGGQTWAVTGQPANLALPNVFAGQTISKIVVDPSNPMTAYAAVYGPQANVWETNDGGQSWTVTPATRGLSGVQVTDLLMQPGNPLHLWAGIEGAGLYESTDGGATWYLNTGAGTFPASGRDGWIALAASRTSPQIMYASIADNFNSASLLRMLRTANAGGFWTDITGSTPNYLGLQGNYDSALVVSPSNPNLVFAGGASGPNSLIESFDGGQNWTDISAGSGTSPQGNHHALAFDSTGALLDGNDGGIWRLANPNPGQVAWTDLNANLQITAFNGIAMDPTNPNVAYGGTAIDGTVKQNGPTPVWTQVLAGDTGVVRVDFTNPLTVYRSGDYSPNNPAFFQRSDDGGATWNSMTGGMDLTQGANVLPPYVMDPTNSARLVLGLTRLYETTNRGVTWTAIGGPGSVGWGVNAPIDSVAIAATSPNTVYASAGGHVLVTFNDGVNWQKADIPGVAGTISALLVDPANSLVAFAAVKSGRIFQTRNGGASWTDVTGNLEILAQGVIQNTSSAFLPVPVYALAIDPVTHNLYAGTEVGVFVTQDVSQGAGGVWKLLARSLPNAPVTQMDFERYSPFSVLAAGTAGRGTLEIEQGVGAFVAGTTLAVEGDTNDDKITIRQKAGSPGFDEVLQNGTVIGTFSQSAFTRILVQTFDGNDTLTVDYTNGDPLPAGGLAFNPGVGNANQIVINQTADLNSETLTATASTVQPVPGAGVISYSNVQYLTFIGQGAANETFNIQSIGPQTGVTLVTGAGTNTINLGGVQGLNSLLGPVTVSAHGSDTMNLNDQGAPQNTNYTLTGNALTRTASGPIAYSGLSQINFHAAPNLTNTLTVDDSQDPAGRSAVLGTGTLTGLVPPTVGFDNNVTYLNLYGGTGGNTFNVNSPTDLGVTLHTGTGNDAVNVQAMGATASQKLTIDGESGNDVVTLGSNAPNTGGTMANIKVSSVVVLNLYGSTSLVVDDSGDATSQGVTLGSGAAGSPTVGGFGTPINFGGGQLTGLTVYGGSGGNTFTVNQLTTLFTTLHTGAGNNTVHVLPTAVGATQTLSLIGGGGKDTVTLASSFYPPPVGGGSIHIGNPGGGTALTVDDSTDPVARAVTLGDGSVANPGVFGLGLPVYWNAGEVSSLTVSGGTGGNAFVVNDPAAPATTIHAGRGNDSVTVQAFHGSPGAGLTVDGQSGFDTVGVGGGTGQAASLNAAALTLTNPLGSFAVTVDDHADAAAQGNVTLGDGTPGNPGVSGMGPTPILWTPGQVAALTVSGGSGGNNFTINNPTGVTTVLHSGTGNDAISVQAFGGGAGTSLTLDGQAGNDRVILGGNTGQAALINTLNITLANGAGTYAVAADDRQDGVARTVTLGDGSVSPGIGGLGAPVYWNAGQIQSLKLFGGPGGNTFNINNGSGSYPGKFVLNISAGTGKNTIHLLNPFNAPNSNLDGGGTGTLVGPNAANVTWNIAGNGAGTVNGVPFTNIASLVGGQGNNTFRFADGATVSGSITGGSGLNTLDYSAYTTDVSVDRLAGTATGVAGGVQNIQDVVQTPGAVTLTNAGGDLFALTGGHQLVAHTLGGWFLLGGGVQSVSAVAEASGNVVCFALMTDHSLNRFDFVHGWLRVGGPGSVIQMSAGLDLNGLASAWVFTAGGALTEFRGSSGFLPGPVGGAGSITQFTALKNDRVAVVTPSQAVFVYDIRVGWSALSNPNFARYVTGVTDGSGQEVLFAVGADQSLWEHDATGWKHVIATPNTVQAVSAGLDATNHANAFVSTTGNGLEEFDTATGTLTQLMAPGALGPGTVVRLNATTADRVFATLADGTVEEHDDVLGWFPLTSPHFGHL